MGLIQSGAACVVSLQSDADEIKGGNELWPDAGPSGVIRPLAPGLREPVSRAIGQAGRKSTVELSTFSACFPRFGCFFQNQWRAKKIKNKQLVLCVSRHLTG